VYHAGDYVFGSSIASDHDLGQAIVIRVAHICEQVLTLLLY
jgi:hypothetical protein